ncbi:MAG: SET domain-containing protein [Candidatus Pacebacteria bacterium]|nr:SET domain-containing protein [Candidatus Paceibacterota bacterium]PIR59804.1 MAG: hypothetical protein COU68_03635 [Candidatus Pacebacteria bacterium CG10_big_fil_rev_8_21_14_0_10_45_6]
MQPSKLHGVGIFAIRDIPAGTNIFFGCEDGTRELFSMKDLENLDPEVKNMIDDFLVIEKDMTVSIPKFGLNGMDISFFFNFSKNPNCQTIDGGQNFVTIMRIAKGDELTIDYSTFDSKYV